MSSLDVVADTYGMRASRIVAFLGQTLNHLHIPFEDIASATNNFASDNLIKRGAIADIYKGKLLWSEQWIDVVIRRFHPLGVLYESRFLKDIATLSHLDHRNIMSIVGYCNESDEKMIVSEYEDNSSLDKYLSDPNFTWSQRLKVCLGIARALDYIHNDIVGHLNHGFHHDIKSSKILLDGDWEAKVFCFGFHAAYDFHSKWSYTDPEKSNRSTHMSDVYSFGVILFEVLCGTKAEIGDGGAYESLAPMATHLYENGKLDAIINSDLRKQMKPPSLSIFSEIAYDCVKKRSGIDRIVERLEEASELLLKHENLEKDYAYLKIPLSDIMLATENFATTYCIRSHTESMGYKAELDHLDIDNLVTTEGDNNKGELPNMRGTVTIERNLSKNYGQVAEGFIREIGILAHCRHPNIESLLGFSWEESEMILVYECAFNGSLADYLGSTGEKNNLTWEQRIRICLDIAYGLEYFHTNMEANKSSIIPAHQGINSANIMLGEKWKAKIGISRFFKFDSELNTTNANNITQGLEYFYSYIKAKKAHPGKTMDWNSLDILEQIAPAKIDLQSGTVNTSTPTNKMLKKDIYSFGVVLFEILFGRLAYDSIYIKEDDKGLAPIAQRHFIQGTLKDMVDPQIMEEAREHGGIKVKGPDQRSLDTFERIAYQCLSKTEAERPIIEVVIKSLKTALRFQVEDLEHMKIKLSDIKLATNNFNKKYMIGDGGYGEVYKAELKLSDTHSLALDMKNEDELPKERIVAIKRILKRADGPGNDRLLPEIEIINRCEHSNIISLLGFCVEGSETILVFEHASKGSLDDYFGCDDGMSNLMWAQRIKMCLSIAYGLMYLHTIDGDKECIIHRDIKSGNILLGENLEVKIADFGLSIFHPTNRPMSTINTKHLDG